MEDRCAKVRWEEGEARLCVWLSSPAEQSPALTGWQWSSWLPGQVSGPVGMPLLVGAASVYRQPGATLIVPRAGGCVCGVYEGEGTLPHSLSFLPIFSTTGSPAFWVELIWESSQASHPLEMCTPHC